VGNAVIVMQMKLEGDLKSVGATLIAGIGGSQIIPTRPACILHVEHQSYHRHFLALTPIRIITYP
jgi:hypothetical protein